MALAEVLEPSMNLDNMIDCAIKKSKEKFINFFMFLKKSEVLGTLGCDLTYTKGRFRTRIRAKRLFAKKPIKSQPTLAAAFFGELLENWEEVEPTRNNLLHTMAYSIQSLLDELKDNIRILGTKITDQNVHSSVDLRTDHWRSLCSNKTDYYLGNLQWFLIRSEHGLCSELEELYQSLDNYIRLVKDTNIRRDFATTTSLETALKTLNKARNELINKAQAVESRLTQLRCRMLK
jgi:hypothetical protein